MRFNFTCLQSTAYYSMQAVLVTSFSVTLIFDRRLWTGSVLRVCSATYQLFLIFFLGYRSLILTLTLTLNPNPNPITDPNPNPSPNPKNKRKQHDT